MRNMTICKAANEMKTIKEFENILEMMKSECKCAEQTDLLDVIKVVARKAYDLGYKDHEDGWQ